MFTLRNSSLRYKKVRMYKITKTKKQSYWYILNMFCYSNLRSLTRVIADRMYILQPPVIEKRNKREPLPYGMDVQIDLSPLRKHVYSSILNI